MGRSEMVDKYAEIVERYDVLRQRILKAEEQKERFKSSIVRKVVSDYKTQLKALEDELAPAEEEVFRLVEELEGKRVKVEKEKASVDERRDELELRHVIGEFGDEEFKAQTEQLDGDIAGYGEQLEEFTAEITGYREMLEKAGAEERRAKPFQEPEPEPVVPVSSPAPVPQKADPATAPGPTPDANVDAGFGDGGDGGSAFEMILDDFPVSNEGAQAPAADDLQGLTELGNSFGDGFPAGKGIQDVLDPVAEAGADDNFGDLGGFGNDSELDGFGDAEAAAPPTTAFLIRDFNGPDEDRYELVDVVTSIGRGRDNQIQIKDDTKVSRYHCRILREDSGYFVEDHNSSNGTMVGGELITRRKVEGNEDVTIGETLFKFLLQ